MTASATSQTRQQLSQIYQNLSESRRQIVRLFSVAYEPVSRSLFLKCLNALDVRQDNGNIFNAQALRAQIEYLIAQDLLVQERGKSPQCNILIAEIATRDAIQAKVWEQMVKVITTHIPIATYYYSKDSRKFNSKEQLLREIRIGIYRRDLKFINIQLECYQQYGYGVDPIKFDEILILLLNNPFDPYWFNQLPQELYELGLGTILLNSVCDLTDAEEPFSFLKAEAAKAKGRCSDNLRLLLTEQFILRDDLESAKSCLAKMNAKSQASADVFWGWLAFLDGDYPQAIALYSSSLKSLKKAVGKRRNVFFESIAGIFFVLALFHEGSPANLKEASGYADIMARSNSWLSYLYTWLQKILLIQQGDMSQKDWINNGYIASYQEHHSLQTFFAALCLYWVDQAQARKRTPRLLKSLCDQAEATGYYWLSAESAELLARLKTKGNQVEAIFSKTDEVPPLVELIKPQQPWELSLKALANLQKKTPVAQDLGQKRLVWLLSFYDPNFMLQPREQKITAKGGWSKGRPIAMKRLYNDPGKLDYLTTQDLKICSHIETNYYGYYEKVDYTFEEHAMLALVGHPLVFWADSPTTRVDIVSGEPELIVKKVNDERLTLEFSPRIKGDKDIIIVKETPTRLKVIEITGEHQRIATILGKKNLLEVPALASEQVLAAISGVSPIVTVHSDIGGGVASATEVTANAQPHLHLLPAGEGLKAALLCRPFGDVGSYYRPGKGGSTVIAEIEGERLQTTRQMEEEKKLANHVMNSCRVLTRYEPEGGEWLIEEPEDCLSLLLELQALEDQVIVEWPEGEKLRVTHQAGMSDFQMQIRRQNDWFAATGELKLDNDLVLDMENLLSLLEKTPSRFIEIKQGQFIALTEKFRARLDELRSYGSKQGQGLQFHPLTSLVLEDAIADVANLKADKHWKQQVKKIKEMKELKPQLPSTLQAELRDYQQEGFEWLSRLAHWGVGACLADQMGLGKTLQALALILNHAPEGATLIIAPTSVCMNWIAEAEKFAPTLNSVQFGSGDRQKTLDNLQPFDLFVCSYGLLQQEEVADMLAKVSWQNIVLDEAQAIKNMATKRSKAAMKLQGKFKLITTGTPIENHLGELWNLFRFINPGLLGSWEQFNQRFAIPIERSQDKQTKKQLKKLIQPFLLRRTKTQVLEELPSRTEITLHVDMSSEEMAFYEALRQKAIARLSDTEATAGAKHLQVLAEIMKLRRACCNTSLVMSDSNLPSAKLEVFGEVLEELLDNRHKALVFSQFVDHLHIIRDYLDEKNISYQYLDGSTPAKKRKIGVDKFQGGEGDVFLISLKAGGTGLNLTAADYVIHMDPWWNPAVEDQASDRAHRIGQKRPVTIYRLVTRGTIEEKIVELHQHKRDLADSLLEGTEMSGKMSTDELLRLMTQ
ncbi:DNA/RNA helicase, superfamily II, SNF2 family [Xenococcus sp. PCC 7305]|uniref:DEAD/DEAH box helicase n=1 Tax=Xenococcus sp. PCC 7305 TaxID=102125 RepID=UPI0002AC5CBB|nr:DEAD/DEAH box helicase [Xenococcus sp. PCC 7305]ELS03363.1 DNA/RNA helicase, superfamily II, SNF2 family [Xenococcus sp. PCC 7305]